MTALRAQGSGAVRVLPVRAYVIRAAVVSCVVSLFLGSLLGILLSWLAGAAVQWMRQLSFTTGVDVQLLPFGDRFGTLETMRDHWFVVIPLSALSLAALGVLVGVLTGLLLAAIDQWLGPPTYVLVESPYPSQQRMISRGIAVRSPGSRSAGTRRRQGS